MLTQIDVLLVAMAMRAPTTRTADGKPLYPLTLFLATHEHLALGFEDEDTAVRTLEALRSAASIGAPAKLRRPNTDHVEQTYAFRGVLPRDGWRVYNVSSEFRRQGIPTRTRAWRFSQVNTNYEVCQYAGRVLSQLIPTYPATLVVPAHISDTTLSYAARFRSKGRIPVLTYLHSNLATITRSSQPLVGLKQNRSVQDEKLVKSIFSSHRTTDSEFAYGAARTNLIIDARPTTNAMANYAKGAGTEPMENYKGCKKVFLGIDNIHVMRDSLSRVTAALRVVDARPSFDDASSVAIDQLALQRSQWLKHMSGVLDGTRLIVRNIHVHASHVLVHCSDGWDRTAQLTSLAALCLDPYYRTVHGFCVLIEKDWISFGHQFRERTGIVGLGRLRFNMAAPRESTDEEEDAGPGLWELLTSSFQTGAASQRSPIFHQFLDCVAQLQHQFPTRFEFNGEMLAELLLHVYAARTGTFLFNTESERRTAPPGKVPPTECTPSVWDELLDEAALPRWQNPLYDAARDASDDMGVLFPDPKNLRFSTHLFRRTDAELNTRIDNEKRKAERLHKRLAEASETRARDAPVEPLIAEDSFYQAARSVGKFLSTGWERVQDAWKQADVAVETADRLEAEFPEAEQQVAETEIVHRAVSPKNPWATAPSPQQPISPFATSAMKNEELPCTRASEPAVPDETPPTADPLGAWKM